MSARNLNFRRVFQKYLPSESRKSMNRAPSHRNWSNDVRRMTYFHALLVFSLRFSHLMPTAQWCRPLTAINWVVKLLTSLNTNTAPRIDDRRVPFLWSGRGDSKTVVVRVFYKPVLRRREKKRVYGSSARSTWDSSFSPTFDRWPGAIPK